MPDMYNRWWCKKSCQALSIGFSLVAEDIDWYSIIYRYITKYDIILLLKYRTFSWYCFLFYYYLNKWSIRYYFSLIFYHLDFFTLLPKCLDPIYPFLRRSSILWYDFIDSYYEIVIQPESINFIFNFSFRFYNIYYLNWLFITNFFMYLDNILEYIREYLCFNKLFIVTFYSILNIYNMIFNNIYRFFYWLYYKTIFGKLLKKLRKKIRFLIWLSKSRF